MTAPTSPVIAPFWTGENVTLYHGDCIPIMAGMPAASVDAIVCDPPYGLEFMGKEWDAPWKSADNAVHAKARINRADEMGDENKRRYIAAAVNKFQAGAPFQAWCLQWATEALRVLKPGGHLLAFGGTRTWHRLAVAVEDAGFEIRDSLAWHYGSGFPKSRNVSRDLDAIRCQCEPIPYSHADDRDPLLGMRGAVHGLAANPETGKEPDVLPEMQRGSARPRMGDLRGSGAKDERPLRSEVRPGQSSMAGRGDAETPEGQLHRPALRPVPTGPADDGTVGRVRDGAPASDGPVDRAPAATPGSREPQGPQSPEQRPDEPRAIPDERGSQTRGGWPVCRRCGKPTIPDGLGTALKPAFEPIVFARKPLAGTVAANVLAHGTGALNIDGCRIPHGDDVDMTAVQRQQNTNKDGGWTYADSIIGKEIAMYKPGGRWPANVVLDNDQAAALDKQSGATGAAAPASGPTRTGETAGTVAYGARNGTAGPASFHADRGGASRFFYVAKAPTAERPKNGEVAHPTVKPIDLMQWLVRLVTPPGGVVLDPFAGSGTTGEAAVREGFSTVLIEREADYLPLIRSRFRRPIDYVLEFEA